MYFLHSMIRVDTAKGGSRIKDDRKSGLLRGKRPPHRIGPVETSNFLFGFEFTKI